MNFYFTFYQLLETAEKMEEGARYLATHALRVSPRDGQANRSLLEECGEKMKGIQKLMFSKSHISKVQLRRTEVLFQAVRIAHQRVLLLVEAMANVDESTAKALVEILRRSQREYRVLGSALSDRMGIPVLVSLPKMEEEWSFTAILQKEHKFEDELIRLIERGVEIFDEERALTTHLAVVRKSLLETKKCVKRLLVKHFDESARSALRADRIEVMPSFQRTHIDVIEAEKKPVGR